MIVHTASRTHAMRNAFKNLSLGPSFFDGALSGSDEGAASADEIKGVCGDGVGICATGETAAEVDVLGS